MKQILIIDKSHLFRAYLQLKLEESDVEVSVAKNVLEGISKLRTYYPDLLILDYHIEGHRGYLEILKQKQVNVNLTQVPVIITAQQISQQKLIELIPYKVQKLFTKPVKIEALLETISELLGLRFEIDPAPAFLDVHVNDSVIFIEIAQGMNQDKLNMLQFRLLELIELYELKTPRVIMMMSDIKLGIPDTPNLYKLLYIVMKLPGMRSQNVCVLTTDDFVKQFAAKQRDYPNIASVDTLGEALDYLFPGLDSLGADERAGRPGDRLLRFDRSGQEAPQQLRFNSDPMELSGLIQEAIENLRIAVVDDDFVIQELIKNAFQHTGALVRPFFDGREFLDALDTERFNLIFLDLVMPGLDGFAVLKFMREHNIQQPVIVLSVMTARETVIRAFQLGVKSYLVKPIKPHDVYKKTAEILRSIF
ncbi:MAG: response regulator [Treponema sp.]|nr:response regulator [Treponema sp.]